MIATVAMTSRTMRRSDRLGEDHSGFSECCRSVTDCRIITITDIKVELTKNSSYVYVPEEMKLFHPRDHASIFLGWLFFCNAFYYIVLLVSSSCLT